MKKTKIICTIGPSSSDKAMLKKMIKEGMNVARINLSHADYSFCDDIIGKLDELNKEMGTCISVMLDTKGPEIRIGKIRSGSVNIEKGDQIKFNTKDELGHKSEVSVDYERFADDLSVGDKVLIDDGLIQFKVIRVNQDSVVCEAENSGELFSNKSVNVPSVKISMPYISKKDIEDIKYACSASVDFLALSFVTCAEDVLSVNDLIIENDNAHIQLIAKIEDDMGVQNIDEILEISDGVMVARGDLGIEVPLEKLPTIQKDLIEKCHNSNKIGIVATQMLDSMETNPRPTRAEVTDIHNAVLDGTDAIMLSGETTIGDYPALAVSTMSKVAESAEYEINYIEMLDRGIKDEKQDITCAISSSVVESAYRLKASVIVAATNSGYTARRVSHLRPICPIIATSPNPNTTKALTLNWGVYPVTVKEVDSTDEIVDRGVIIAKKMFNLDVTDKVIITGGFPLMESRHTNFMKIEEV